MITGPFYVKEEDKFVPADFCKECAFFGEKQNICVLLGCIKFAENEEEYAEMRNDNL